MDYEEKSEDDQTEYAEREKELDGIAKQLTEHIRSIIDPLGMCDREHVMSFVKGELYGKYCEDCWCDHEGRMQRCQCWNDE